MKAVPLLVGAAMAVVGVIAAIAGVTEYSNLMQVGWTSSFVYEPSLRLIVVGASILLVATLLTAGWWWVAYRRE